MLRKLLVLAGALVAAGAIVGPAAAFGAVTSPVPSLTPAATQRLWSELVRRPRVLALRSADCRPLRAVFYAPTDWRRLATKLAANPSPCAQYYVSVPPVGDKTQQRGDEAWRIRALGPSFHALAEISVNGWTAWVASTGRSWYEAGVEARRRMAATGYDVTLGDTWALNELSSAVRQGTGNARANMRAFLNGLHDGDGTLPAMRGTVFIAGIGQATTDLSLYQARLQDWYEDSAFWSDVSRFVADWSQEVYGDARHYAVPGATREARRDLLNEYLLHQTALAAAAPAAADAARAFLSAASSPLANAAWRYDAAFGWTDVTPELMQDYVSAQTYALRAAGTSRFGYAWSPKNLIGVPTAEFNAQTDALLTRLAAAIADSADTPEAACGPGLCAGSLDGATATPAWRTFAAWKPSRLAFVSPEQTLAPGAVSAPLTVELQTSAGGAYEAGVPVTVELTSSSPTAELAASPGGPWAPTLTVPIASGASATAVYVRDATAGTATITAAAAGKSAATQVVAVGAAAPAPPPAPDPSGGGATPAPQPADVQPTNDPAPVTTVVATPPTVAPTRAGASLRAAGVRVRRTKAAATVFARFSVGAGARLEARLTPFRSTRPLQLLAGTTLAGTRVTTKRPAAEARVARAGTYLFKARVGAAQLISGRTYLVRLTAVGPDGRRRTLTIRVRA